MKLLDYTKRLSPAQKQAFALEVGTTLPHVRNVSYGSRTASAALARQIALVTNREVAEWDLRPDDWHLIWEDLISHPDAPPIPMAQEARRAA